MFTHCRTELGDYVPFHSPVPALPQRLNSKGNPPLPNVFVGTWFVIVLGLSSLVKWKSKAMLYIFYIFLGESSLCRYIFQWMPQVEVPVDAWVSATSIL